MSGKVAEDVATTRCALKALSRGHVAEIERTGRGSDRRSLLDEFLEFVVS